MIRSITSTLLGALAISIGLACVIVLSGWLWVKTVRMAAPPQSPALSRRVFVYMDGLEPGCSSTHPIAYTVIGDTVWVSKPKK